MDGSSSLRITSKTGQHHRIAGLGEALRTKNVQLPLGELRCNNRRSCQVLHVDRSSPARNPTTIRRTKNISHPIRTSMVAVLYSSKRAICRANSRCTAVLVPPPPRFSPEPPKPQLPPSTPSPHPGSRYVATIYARSGSGIFNSSHRVCNRITIRLVTSSSAALFAALALDAAKPSKSSLRRLLCVCPGGFESPPLLSLQHFTVVCNGPNLRRLCVAEVRLVPM